MEICEANGVRAVHFVGRPYSQFNDFTEEMPALADDLAKARFLQKCDRLVESACPKLLCTEMVDYEYAERDAMAEDNSPIGNRVQRPAVIGVYVECAAYQCPLDLNP